MRLDPDYSVILLLFQTSFEKRQAMFANQKIVLPRTVSLHRRLGFEKELNAQKSLAAADNFLRVTRR